MLGGIIGSIGGGLVNGILGGGKGGGLLGGIGGMVGKMLDPLGILGGNQEQNCQGKGLEEKLDGIEKMLQEILAQFKDQEGAQGASGEGEQAGGKADLLEQIKDLFQELMSMFEDQEGSAGGATHINGGSGDDVITIGAQEAAG